MFKRAVGFEGKLRRWGTRTTIVIEVIFISSLGTISVHYRSSGTVPENIDPILGIRASPLSMNRYYRYRVLD